MATQFGLHLSVGVRELHNRTSELMSAVESGAVLEVTRHGKVLGQIVPVETGPLYDKLKAAGMIHEPAPRTTRAKLPPPIALAPGASVSDLIKEQRR